MKTFDEIEADINAIHDRVDALKRTLREEIGLYLEMRENHNNMLMALLDISKIEAAIEHVKFLIERGILHEKT